MAKIDFFANAAPATAKGKKKADTKPRIATAELMALASLDAVAKSIKTMREQVDEVVKGQMRDYFVNAGVARGARPENYKGFEDAAEASLELRCRSTASPLDETAQSILEAEGIDTETHTTFALNNDVLTPQVMALVQKALNGVPGIPTNLFNVTQKVVVAENALNQLFTKGDAKARALLDVCGVLAVKPKISEDFNDTLARVTDMLKVSP
jgi:hypothetical protein